MGQREIINILKNNYPEWSSYREIQSKIITSRANMFRCLKQLKKRDEIELKVIIEHKPITRFINMYRYKEE